MIITQITGGLGNQLFQYAAGFCVAKRLNTDLALYFTLEDTDTKRKPAIAELFPDLKWVEESDVRDYIPKNTLERIWQRLLPFQKKVFYKEPHFHYDDNILKISDNTYLKGFWQSEKYFIEYLDELKFKLLSAISSIKLDSVIEEKLNTQNSISVHVRKGDYLKPPYISYYHQLSNDYYKKAVHEIISSSTAAKVFVFTDDIEWVKQNLDIGYPYEIVSGQYTCSAFEDMKGIIECKHHIIANSSFSWWAAWLGSSENKKIVAPAKWFNEGPLDTEDLIPENWIKI